MIKSFTSILLEIKTTTNPKSLIIKVKQKSSLLPPFFSSQRIYKYEIFHLNKNPLFPHLCKFTCLLLISFLLFDLFTLLDIYLPEKKSFKENVIFTTFSFPGEIVYIYDKYDSLIYFPFDTLKGKQIWLLIQLRRHSWKKEKII